MWLDILLQNRDSLVEALSSVEGRVGDLRRLIEAGDRTGLEHYLETAREFRRGLDRGGFAARFALRETKASPTAPCCSVLWRGA